MPFSVRPCVYSHLGAVESRTFGSGWRAISASAIRTDQGASAAPAVPPSASRTASVFILIVVSPSPCVGHERPVRPPHDTRRRHAVDAPVIRGAGVQRARLVRARLL